MSQTKSSWGSSYQNCGNISNSFNTVISDEKSQILAWLSPLEPQKRHQEVQNHRLDGVGEWLLEIDEFTKWRDAEDGSVNPVLFGYGDPGVGKTHIGSLVIDALCDQAGRQNIAVACLYCDFLARKEQSTTYMIGALLKQLLSRSPDVPETIRQRFEDSKQHIGGRSLRLPEMLEILKMTLESLDRAYICIDALDEFLSERLPEFLRSLQTVIQESPGTRLFITSRPHVRAEVEKYLACGIVSVLLKPSREDINRYLIMKIEEDTDPDAMDDNLREDILRLIPENISGIFLLVSLSIDAILGETTIYQRRQKLNKMTSGLGLADAYSATMERIKEQRGNRPKLGMDVLMWVSHAERALSPDELCYALGVKIGSTDHNLDNIPSIRSLLGSCLGLVTVDEDQSSVRLFHFTLQEYLCTHPEIFGRPHSILAVTCLTCLHFESVKKLSLSTEIPPFLIYAACNWGIHASKETTEDVKLLAIKLLTEYGSHVSAKLLLLLFKHPSGQKDISWATSPDSFTGLHCAAFFGLEEIAAALMEITYLDANAFDITGQTPLIWAAQCGNEGVVKLLLEQESVNPNTPDTILGKAPISWAAQKGHEKVVRLLLERKDVNPNTLDYRRRGPLVSAAMYGYEGVVKLLLGHEGVNPNETDYWGWTPIVWAITGGHEGVVKLLLERKDVEPDREDPKSGQTPIGRAAFAGHEGIVKLFLAREDVNPDKPDNAGRTALSWAAGKGNEGVVKALLGHKDVNPDKPDTLNGRTPLWWAACVGSERVLMLLLEREEVDPYKPDKDGLTPIDSAAEWVREGLVRMLSDRVL